MKKIQSSEFKATCLAVLDEIEATGEPVMITKHGREVAQLFPAFPTGDERFPQRSLRGTIRFLGDVVAPVLDPDDWDANRGQLG